MQADLIHWHDPRRAGERDERQRPIRVDQLLLGSIEGCCVVVLNRGAHVRLSVAVSSADAPDR
jgi:hypothetical protein